MTAKAGISSCQNVKNFRRVAFRSCKRYFREYSFSSFLSSKCYSVVLNFHRLVKMQTRCVDRCDKPKENDATKLKPQF